MRRRDVLGGGAALPLVLAPRAFAAEVQTIKLAKAFEYLDLYLSLPADRRSAFYLAYIALKNRQPYPDLKAVIVDDAGSRVPLALGRDGSVLHPPSLALLRSRAVLEMENDPAVDFALEIRSASAAQSMDAASLSQSLAQVGAAIRQAAGPLALVAPRFDAALFPDAGAGRVLLDGSKAAPLRMARTHHFGEVAWYRPADFPGARTIVLDRAPTRVLLGPSPREG